MKPFTIFHTGKFLIFMLLATSAHAGNGLHHDGITVGVAIGLSTADVVSDASTQPDFDITIHGQINVNYALSTWFEIETGFLEYYENETDKMTDQAGSYQLNLSTNTFQLGGRAFWNIDNHLRAYFRLGGSYYRVNLKVDESFGDVKEAGQDSANSTGNGYYYGVGIITNASQNLEIQMEYLGQHLTEVFEDSSRPFDIRYKGVTLGARYNF